MKCWRQLLGNQKSIQSVEKSGVTSTKEGKASEKQHQVTCFFDQKGIVHKEFVPPGQTVNNAFYIEVLKGLRDNVQRKRPDQWRNNTWLLHHDIEPAHAALLTWRILTTNNMTVVSWHGWTAASSGLHVGLQWPTEASFLMFLVCGTWIRGLGVCLTYLNLWTGPLLCRNKWHILK